MDVKNRTGILNKRNRLIYLIVLPIMIWVVVLGIYWVWTILWTTNPDLYFGQIERVVNDYPRIFSAAEKSVIENTTVPLQPALVSSVANFAITQTVTTSLRVPVIILLLGGVSLLLSWLMRKQSNIEAQVSETHNEDKTKPSTRLLPEIQLTLYMTFVQAVLTADGLIITILSGFLVLSGIVPPVIIIGFLILILSILAGFFSISSGTTGIIANNSGNIQVNPDSLSTFYMSASYAFWYFVIGIGVVVGGLL